MSVAPAVHVSHAIHTDLVPVCVLAVVCQAGKRDLLEGREGMVEGRRPAEGVDISDITYAVA